MIRPPLLHLDHQKDMMNIEFADPSEDPDGDNV
jgi:hypothetical protein